MAAAPPKSALDFSTLSSQFRVMGTTPAWPMVQEAMDRLERPRAPGDPYPEYAGDVECVRGFAALLERSAETIAAALLCGAAVGRAARTDALGEQVVLGLRAISEAYRFGEKSEVEVAEILHGLKSDLTRVTPSLADAAEGMPPLSALGLEAWLDALRERLRRVDLDPSPAEMERMVRGAWDAVLSRLDGYFRGSQRGTPDLDEVVASVAMLEPTASIRFDLNAMTVADWSHALRVSLQSQHLLGPEPFAPAVILAAASLHALGFRARDRKGLANWLGEYRAAGAPRGQASTPDPVEDAFSFTDGWPPTRTSHGVLILRRERDSLTDSWRPSPTVAAVALTSSDFAVLAEDWRHPAPPPPIEPGIHLLAVEMPMDEPGSENLVIHTLRERFKLQRDIPVVYLYSRRPRQKTRGPVLTPTRLEDLFADAPVPS